MHLKLDFKNVFSWWQVSEWSRPHRVAWIWSWGWISQHWAGAKTWERPEGKTLHFHDSNSSADYKRAKGRQVQNQHCFTKTPWMKLKIVTYLFLTGPLVHTKLGNLRGAFMTAKGKETVVSSYFGVPFAKPPVGPLRLAPPQPAEAWQGVRDATKQPHMWD